MGVLAQILRRAHIIVGTMRIGLIVRRVLDPDLERAHASPESWRRQELRR